MTETSVSQSVASNDGRVIIFDTTLRDGEQSPGCSMTVDEKLRVAEVPGGHGRRRDRGRLPDRVGGRLPGGPRDRQARQARAWSAASPAPPRATSTAPPRRSQPAERRRIHTFIGTSPLHRKYQLQLDAERGPRAGDRQRHPRPALHRRRRVERAWTPRAPSPTSCSAASRAPSRLGATTINIPDTVGYAYPEEFADLIREIREQRAQHRQGGDLGPLPQRSGPGRRQLACARSRPVRARSSARSTASASGPATARSRRW